MGQLRYPNSFAFGWLIVTVNCLKWPWLHDFFLDGGQEGILVIPWRVLEKLGIPLDDYGYILRLTNSGDGRVIRDDRRMMTLVRWTLLLTASNEGPHCCCPPF